MIQRMISPPTDHLLVREIEARAARLAEDEFVEFSFAGAPPAMPSGPNLGTGVSLNGTADAGTATCDLWLPVEPA